MKIVMVFDSDDQFYHETFNMHHGADAIDVVNDDAKEGDARDVWHFKDEHESQINEVLSALFTEVHPDSVTAHKFGRLK